MTPKFSDRCSGVCPPCRWCVESEPENTETVAFSPEDRWNTRWRLHSRAKRVFCVEGGVWKRHRSFAVACITNPPRLFTSPPTISWEIIWWFGKSRFWSWRISLENGRNFVCSCGFIFPLLLLYVLFGKLCMVLQRWLEIWNGFFFLFLLSPNEMLQGCWEPG